MRSEKFHLVMSNGGSRFAFCNTIAKGMRVMHVSGARMADSINKTMAVMETKAVVVVEVPPVR